MRQANGVAAYRENDVPELFWPRENSLTPASVSGRGLGPLSGYLDKILAVKANHERYNFGDGHANGCMQCLTANGPAVENAERDSQARSESLDHRIGRELNDGGRDSLFVYTGDQEGWLGGPCISFRGFEQRRAAVYSPSDAFQLLFGSGSNNQDAEMFNYLAAQKKSVNDLARDQINALKGNPRLSARDLQRLDLHLTSIRDLEEAIGCGAFESTQFETDAGHSDGDDVLSRARLHLEVAVLAVACGANRSVCLQIGTGNDGRTSYRDKSGALMENFHYVSHRIKSHGSDGEAIPNAHELHSEVDQHFCRTFVHLLDKLSEYEFDTGNLLDAGMCVWMSELANGYHSPEGVPWIVAGSCGGVLKQGQYIHLQDDGSHIRLLNGLATAVGVRTPGLEVCNDFGDPDRNRTPASEIFA